MSLTKSPDSTRGDANPVASVSIISSFEPLIAAGTDGLPTARGTLTALTSIFDVEQIRPVALTGREGSDIMMRLVYPTTLATVVAPVINLYAATVSNPDGWIDAPNDIGWVRLVDRTGTPDFMLPCDVATDCVADGMRFGQPLGLERDELVDVLGCNLIVPVVKTALSGTVSSGVLADQLALARLEVKVI